MSPSVLTITRQIFYSELTIVMATVLRPPSGVECRMSSLWCMLSISSGESEFSVGQLTFDSLVLDVRTQVNVVSAMIVLIMRYTRWVPIPQ